jgi:VWFA-related protein
MVRPKKVVGIGVTLGLLLGLFPLSAQVLKIRQISLKDFPKLRLSVSIESEWGSPVPIDTAGLTLMEDGQLVGDLLVTAQDSVAVPIHTVIVLDKSGSMKGQAMEQARIGAAAYVDMMSDQDTAAYLTFDTQVTVVLPFSSDRDLLKGEIMATGVGSDTALIDAVYQALELFAASPREGVRLVLLLTDGRENKSQTKIDKLYSMAASQNCSIFTIGLGAQTQPEMLRELALRTEGNYYPAPQPGQLKGIYEQISLLLHSQLMLAYTTNRDMDNQWRTLRISVPYMGQTINCERPYLAAKASYMPTDLLQRIDQQITEGARSVAETNPVRGSDLPTNSEWPLIIILSGLLIGLILLLLVVLRRRS